MSSISLDQIKKLREETSAGVMEVKRALEEAKGNEAEAKKLLAQWGATQADKKAGREAGAGLVYAYIHGQGRAGVLLEVNCETDFVAKTDDFKNLCKELSLQVASMAPMSVEELLTQEYIREPSQKVEDLVKEVSAKTGEKIEVKRFVRYEVGR